MQGFLIGMGVRQVARRGSVGLVALTTMSNSLYYYLSSLERDRHYLTFLANKYN